MNLVFLQGEIVSNTNFNFIYKGSHISIVEFNIKVQNNNIILLKAYDEIADYIFANCKVGDCINIIGSITNTGTIINEVYCS